MKIIKKMQKNKTRGNKFKQIIMFAVVLLAALFVQASNTDAATSYYVCQSATECNSGDGSGWSTGDNNNDCENKSAPCETIQGGINKMSSGDTLIIGDGTYTGDDNMILTHGNHTVRIPEGSESIGYTKIHAENDGGVTIDGEGDRKPIKIKGNNTVDGSTGSSPSHDYIELKGLVAINSEDSSVHISYVDHIKLINIGGANAVDGNASVFSLSRGSYILAEGIYAWGGGRYKISTYHSDHLVLRNCVARFDRADASNEGPIGIIAVYQSTNIEVQNCIAIDGDTKEYWENYSQHQGAFGVPMTYPDTLGRGPVNFNNCISVNNQTRFGTSDYGGNFPADVYYNNCVGWNLETSTGTPFMGSQGSSQFNQCSFGEVDNENQNVNNAYFNGWRRGNTNATKNTIWYNFKNGGLFYDIEDSDYNNIFGLDAGEDIDVSGTNSQNTISINPTQNSLLYLPRIEAESDLANAGEGEVRVGAEIIKMYGKPGTMWGETGYNLLQDGTNGQDDIDLWPFPNENLIKEKMQDYSYDNGNLSGDRGFASSTATQLNGVDDVTLTSYIWEYLGNEIPCEIYGTCATPIINTATPHLFILLKEDKF